MIFKAPLCGGHMIFKAPLCGSHMIFKAPLCGGHIIVKGPLGVPRKLSDYDLSRRLDTRIALPRQAERQPNNACRMSKPCKALKTLPLDYTAHPYAAVGV